MFELNRRRVIAAFGAAALLASTPLSAFAQEVLPELKILAPAAAGGGWDSAARSLQQVLTQTGAVRSVQVTNVAGAGGTVGLAQFVNSADGSGSDVMVGGLVMVGAIISNKSPVNLSQVTPLARLTGDPLVIVVPKDSELKTIQDLAKAVKDNTAGTLWAGGSAGGADHILAALFAKAAGADPAQINYVAFSGGGEALAAMLGGRVTAGISGYGEFEGQIKSGDLRALAVSSPERFAGVDVPTLKEQGIDVEVVNWRGLFAGPNISAEDKAKLSGVVEKAVKSPEWAEVLKARGWSDYYANADEFATFVTSENTRVHDVLKTIGLAD
ncbi:MULTISPECIES: Bug family tripartite tricarboxylate transporter substrate binding protein [unclassified Aureimonas]|uniref:Bug family tripartite tricarboxylate transporter substrate binding protein n=1 Tax=unclassified Aureimonas TaxID=2615206 RepID=UPI0007007D9A|nr:MULTISPECIES: tripartite tricarboxylate transporter substrate-binding protein [unclassified Aureimonas]KQT69867.1 C4-dicarboxylate ABC transporter substrate-binding protein [Aureimonas sp. Leaf427]KQT75980.1 C4-dicarboxylate ABC transporter substrate-binding protein [Aureimonas sp. Leaf460]